MAKIELTRRRILGGLVTIGAGSAAAGAGTFALFSDSDTESVDGLSAGTFDLQVGESGSFSFNKSDIVPTDEGEASATLSQVGTSTASALAQIKVTSVTSAENGNEDSEPVDDDGDGELKDQVDLDIWITADNTTYDLESSGNVTESGSEGNVPTTEYHDGSNGTTWGGAGTDTPDVISEFDTLSNDPTFVVDWVFDSQDNNNAAQGDSLTVEFEFLLEQRQ